MAGLVVHGHSRSHAASSTPVPTSLSSSLVHTTIQDYTYFDRPNTHILINLHVYTSLAPTARSANTSAQPYISPTHGHHPMHCRNPDA